MSVCSAFACMHATNSTATQSTSHASAGHVAALIVIPLHINRSYIALHMEQSTRLGNMCVCHFCDNGQESLLASSTHQTLSVVSLQWPGWCSMSSHPAPCSLPHPEANVPHIDIPLDGAQDAASYPGAGI